MCEISYLIYGKGNMHNMAIHTKHSRFKMIPVSQLILRQRGVFCCLIGGSKKKPKWHTM